MCHVFPVLSRVTHCSFAKLVRVVMQSSIEWDASIPVHRFLLPVLQGTGEVDHGSVNVQSKPDLCVFLCIVAGHAGIESAIDKHTYTWAFGNGCAHRK